MTEVLLMLFLHLVFIVLKAQEDIAGGQKRVEEEEGEDQYNDENTDQVCSVGNRQSPFLLSQFYCPALLT